MLINSARAFYERTTALRENRTTSYVFGLATIALALLARFVLARQLVGFPFLVFFPAIFLTSFICGWRAGAVAAVFGGFAARYFFIGDSFVPIRVAVTSTWAGYALYGFAVVIVLFLVSSMHVAFRDFAESEDKRKRLNEELESRVHERTLALEDANQRLRDEAASLAAAEARILQMQKMEAVGQLTGGIAHDFNNMLAVIVGSLDIARRQLHVDPAKSERFIANALDGAQRGAQLTSRLLAFSRQQPLDPRPLDANKLVRETSELLRRSLGENIHLETVLADDLWRIFADAPQLESALVNLCVNSRDAMPDGGNLTLRTANVHLDNSDGRGGIEGHSGDHVAIVVHDTGCGMSPEVLARAFDPFYTTKAPGQGTGLGLSQAYGFVSQSGGRISIDSQPGTGTTVSIHLLRYVGSEQSEAAPSAKISPLTPGNKEVILVVEDEDRVRTMTVEALRDLGYSVISAAGPQQALDELNSILHLHLLVTDVVMPGMNGPALAEHIKALRPSMKVLYTTGYARNAVLSDGMFDREVGILQKPFTIDQLTLKVRQALGGQ
ncbi:MAG TPA: ATP-binding protein [Steroidobacteraceae bacterium]|nr:ATP-binding protein [Steroidobacteraceae bacterium]